MSLGCSGTCPDIDLFPQVHLCALSRTRASTHLQDNERVRRDAEVVDVKPKAECVPPVVDALQRFGVQFDML